LETFEKRDVEVRSRRTWLYVAQLVAVAAFPLALLLLPSVGLVALFGAAIIAASLSLGLAWSRWPRVRRVELRADADGLHFGGRLAVARRSIRSVGVHPHGRGTIVRLVRYLRPVEIVVRDPAEGQALAAALRLDPSHSIARYGMSDGTFRRSLVHTLLVAVGFFVLSMAALPLCIKSPFGWAVEVLVLAAYVIVLMRQRLTVSVGADGVRIRRWFGGARFVRYADMLDIATDGTNVTLRLRDGERLTMSSYAKRLVRLMGTDMEEAEGLVDRVRARIDAHRAHDDARVRAALVKGGRTTSEWLRALQHATDATASFRAAAVPPEVLWAVVEDTTAPATARVGAAIALRAALDEPARARLRVAAEACAAPKLRVALETASRADDERALTEALDAIDDSPRHARRA
jgi:hypothetical protein